MNTKELNDSIEIKLRIVKVIFGLVLYDKQNCRIDDERDTTGYTRAYAIAKTSIESLDTDNVLRIPAKEELIYINKTISKLISILGTNKSIINQQYVSTKLNTAEKNPYEVHTQWIDAYIQLLNIIKQS